MKTALLLALALLSSPNPPHERRVGRGVQFYGPAVGVVRPVLPVELRVAQESGEAPGPGVMTCDVVVRSHEVVADGMERVAGETVLKCGGGRTFAVREIVFTESGGGR